MDTLVLSDERLKEYVLLLQQYPGELPESARQEIRRYAPEIRNALCGALANLLQLEGGLGPDLGLR